MRLLRTVRPRESLAVLQAQCTHFSHESIILGQPAQTCGQFFRIFKADV
jgi:hypothetical protein